MNRNGWTAPASRAGGHWETKIYRSGKIGEKVKYFVPDSRSRKSQKSSAAKLAGNANNVTRKVARALNENFKKGDGWITLTYGPKRYARVLARAAKMDPEIPELDRIWFAAEHELRLCLDRTRAALSKKGVELRYLAVTSDTDGDTGELVRVHHHLVVPAGCVDVLMEKWGAEEFQDEDHPHLPRKLRAMDDYTPLAEYMMKQVRHIGNAKKYMPSRNLLRSEPRARKVISGAALRPPKGSRLLYADQYTGERDCQYIRYLLPREQWSGVWKRPTKKKKGKVVGKDGS